jgi:hypothetical protein
MLIGPNGSLPVFTTVTADDAVSPTLTDPKSIAVALIVTSVSTAATSWGATPAPAVATASTAAVAAHQNIFGRGLVVGPMCAS